MGAIRDVLRGLGGSLAVALPLVLAWVGVLCVGKARGMRVAPLRVAADALLILCLFSLQLYLIAEVRIGTPMAIQTKVTSLVIRTTLMMIMTSMNR
jgi:hypothetical protein